MSLLKDKKYCEKKHAFSLAEVLVVLAIIGVVVTMTIPVLIQNAKDSSQIVALNKSYSVLEYAFRRAYAEYNSPEYWCDKFKGSSENCVMQMFAFYTKTIKECGTKRGCFYSGAYKNISGSAPFDIDGNITLSKFILQDGIMVAVENFDTCGLVYGESTSLKNVCGKLYVDVNGNRAPNAFGTDAFMFYVTQFAVEPAGTTFDKNSPFETTCALGNGWGCTAWAMYNKNFAYKYCEQISWATGAQNCREMKFFWD